MLASSLVMVRPANFGSNPEIFSDNVFQKAEGVGRQVSFKAIEEFDQMVLMLKSKNSEVLVFDDPGQPETTDSAFPNNWFSTHSDGMLILYPMKSKARRVERRPEFVERLKNDFEVDILLDLSHYENENIYLEGTRSRILDHEDQVAYMCRSERLNDTVLEKTCEAIGYKPFLFEAYVSVKPIYHTNVIMGIGEKFVIACTEVMEDATFFEQQVEARGKELIKMTVPQVKSCRGGDV